MLILSIALCQFLFVASLPAMGRQTNFDEEEAKRLVKLSAGAYGSTIAQEGCVNRTFNANEGYRAHKWLRMECDSLNNLCESIIVVSDVQRTIVFAFRGTRSKGQLLLEGWNTINDGVDFFGMGHVNNYFMNGLLVLWSEIEQLLNENQYKDYRLVFTGHSLGGALATLAAARTVRQGFRNGNDIRVVTFGQPRVGTLQFARNFDTMIPYCFRVVFRNDIVPHLPSCKKDHTRTELDDQDRQPCDANEVGGPYHQGTEIWYPDSMESGANYIECVGMPRNEDFSCSDRVKFYYDRTETYIWDHRHYYNVRVPEYGKTGCDPSQPEGKPSLIEKVVNKINILTRTIGL